MCTFQEMGGKTLLYPSHPPNLPETDRIAYREKLYYSILFTHVVIVIYICEGGAVG